MFELIMSNMSPKSRREVHLCQSRRRNNEYRNKVTTFST